MLRLILQPAGTEKLHTGVSRREMKERQKAEEEERDQTRGTVDVSLGRKGGNWGETDQEVEVHLRASEGRKNEGVHHGWGRVAGLLLCSKVRGSRKHLFRCVSGESTDHHRIYTVTRRQREKIFTETVELGVLVPYPEEGSEARDQRLPSVLQERQRHVKTSIFSYSNTYSVTDISRRCSNITYSNTVIQLKEGKCKHEAWTWSQRAGEAMRSQQPTATGSLRTTHPEPHSSFHWTQSCKILLLYELATTTQSTRNHKLPNSEI